MQQEISSTITPKKLLLRTNCKEFYSMCWKKQKHLSSCTSVQETMYIDKNSPHIVFWGEWSGYTTWE